MNKPTKKRQHPRTDSLNFVSVQHYGEEGDPDILTIGRTLDLSEGGIRLEVTVPLPLFSFLSLHIALEETIIKVRGKVVYLSAVEENLIHMGLTFTGISKKDKDTINRFLLTHGKKSNPLK